MYMAGVSSFSSVNNIYVTGGVLDQVLATLMVGFILIDVPLAFLSTANQVATLAFARGIGEYGSVVFISGNLPLKTEITPLLIVIKLEQFDYDGAAALGFIMLVTSFLMLFAINSVLSTMLLVAIAAGIVSLYGVTFACRSI